MPDDTDHTASYPQHSSAAGAGRSRSAGAPGAGDDHRAGVAGPRQHPAAPTTTETTTHRSRGISVLSAGVGAIVGSFFLLFVPIIVYAFVLAFRARGLPDQSAINHFAATLSPAVMPWLERVLTPLLAFWAVRRTGPRQALDGLTVGFLAGVLGLGVTLAFGGRLALGSVVPFLVLMGLGWLGGLLAQKSPSRS